MKLWIDDVRPAPDGWVWAKTTNEALRYITSCCDDIEQMSIDHDAGVNSFGGDFVNVLNEMERLSRLDKIIVGFPIHIHSMNPVGVENMHRIIRANGWKEI